MHRGDDGLSAVGEVRHGGLPELADVADVKADAGHVAVEGKLRGLHTNV